MNTNNVKHVAAEVQVSLPPLSSWQRIVRDRPILLLLKRRIKQLDPRASTDQFWCKWHAVEHQLAEIFDGELRPDIGTVHDRAWHHLFVQFDDVADRRAA